MGPEGAVSESDGGAAGGDLVFLLPGVMGSSLKNGQGKEIWGLGKGAALAALRTLGRSLDQLVLPEDVGDGPAPDDVRPVALVPDLRIIPGLWSPIDGYSGIQRFLAEARFRLVGETASAPGNLVAFPYDWRLSNRYNAELLKRRVETSLSRWRQSRRDRAEAKVIFIAHSMGGLVARWYIEQLGGSEIVRTLITLGTPHRGSVKALAQLVNGVRKGIGPLRIDLTRLARSFPSSYELLPEYACIEATGKAPAKITEVTVPHLDPDRVEAGMEFHEKLNGSELDYPLVPVVGIGQPTLSSGRLEGEVLVPLHTFSGREHGGDGTVSRLAARPFQMKERDSAVRGVGEGHGALPSNRSVLDQLDFVLTAEDVIYRAVDAPEPTSTQEVVGLEVPDVHLTAEPVKVSVHAVPRVLEVVAFDERLRIAGQDLVRFGSSLDEEGRTIGECVFDRLAPGAYRLVARAPDDPAGVEVAPVHAATLVWDGR